MRFVLDLYGDETAVNQDQGLSGSALQNDLVSGREGLPHQDFDHLLEALLVEVAQVVQARQQLKLGASGRSLRGGKGFCFNHDGGF